MLTHAIPYALAFVEQRLSFTDTIAAKQKAKKHGTPVQTALCIFDWDKTFASTSGSVRCADIVALPEFQERLVNLISGRKVLAHVLPLEHHGDDALLLVEFRLYNKEFLVELECLPIGEPEWHRKNRSGVCRWCGGRSRTSKKN